MSPFLVPVEKIDFPLPITGHAFSVLRSEDFTCLARARVPVSGEAPFLSEIAANPGTYIAGKNRQKKGNLIIFLLICLNFRVNA